MLTKCSCWRRSSRRRVAPAPPASASAEAERGGSNGRKVSAAVAVRKSSRRADDEQKKKKPDEDAELSDETLEKRRLLVASSGADEADTSSKPSTRDGEEEDESTGVNTDSQADGSGKKKGKESKKKKKKKPATLQVHTSGSHHRTLSYGSEERDMIRRDSLINAQREVYAPEVDMRLLQSDKRDPRLAMFNDMHMSRFRASAGAADDDAHLRRPKSPPADKLPARPARRGVHKMPMVESVDDLPTFHQRLADPARLSASLSPRPVSSASLPDSDSDGDEQDETIATKKANNTKTLRLFVGTWNLNGRAPPDDLHKFIPPHDYDMYVLGTQECENSIQKSLVFQSKSKWVGALAGLLGDDFVQIAQETLVAVHIIVFLRADLVSQAWDIETAQLATGWGDVVGNKGGVGVGLRLGNTSFAFVNSHFHAHHNEIEARNADFHKINAGLTIGFHPAQQELQRQRTNLQLMRERKASLKRLREQRQADDNDGGAPKQQDEKEPPSPVSSSSSSDNDNGADDDERKQQPKNTTTTTTAANKITSMKVRGNSVADRYDHVVWMGDLNYRIEGNQEAMAAVMSEGMMEVMHNNDQLRTQIRRGLVFEGYQEAPIDFMPTYKFKVGTDDYDNKRVAGWTDRILYRSSTNVENNNRTKRKKKTDTSSSSSDNNNKSNDSTNTNGLQVIEYTSVPEMRTSDHKPVRATFRVAFVPMNAGMLDDRGLWHSFTMQRMKTQVKLMMRRKVKQFNSEAMHRQVDQLRRSYSGQSMRQLQLQQRFWEQEQAEEERAKMQQREQQRQQQQQQQQQQQAQKQEMKQELDVFVGTWNLHGKPPPDDLSTFIPPDKFDMYVLGTEECENSIQKSFVFNSKDKWVRTLLELLGDSYVVVAESNLVALHVIVLIRVELAHEVWGVESVSVATGFADRLGNKGAVAVSMRVGATSMLFVNCHFHAHQHNVEQRNADYHKINERLAAQLTAPVTRATTTPQRNHLSAVDYFDRVVWMGDLNYRIEGNRAAVDALLEADMHEALLNNDQLNKERLVKRSVFHKFYEAPITFAPTYKFDSGTDVYDTSAKARIPSFTDRILVRSNNDGNGGGVEVLKYDSVMSIRTSDHKPVFAHLRIKTQPVKLFQ